MSDGRGDLKILIVEDRSADAELMVAELRRAGFRPEWVRVQTEAELRHHLEHSPDLILADFTLPAFDAFRILAILGEERPEIPCIIVSGSIGEDIAVEAMRRGASDYLLKDRLTRLGPAVEHVLEARRLREQRRAAERALQESEERFRRLAENARDIIFRYRMQPARRFEYISPAVTRITGYTPEEFYAAPDLWLQIIHPDDHGSARISPRPEDYADPLVLRLRRKDGTVVWTEQRRTPIFDQSGAVVVVEGISRDITQQKETEEQAARRLEQLQALRDIDSAITASLDVSLVLNVLLDKVTSHLGVDAAAVLVLDPRAQVLECGASRGFRGVGIRTTRLRLGEGEAGRAALDRTTVHIADLRAAPFSRQQPLAGEGLVAYAAVPLVAKGQVKGVLEVFHRSPLAPGGEWLDFLETLAGQAAIAIDSTSLFENLQRANADLILAYDTTLEGWVRALDLRDKETEGHTQRVTELTLLLARRMGLSEEVLRDVRRGALLHDIGKMGIPDSILLKPGPLTDEEWKVMKMHPVYAHQLLSPIPFLRPALAIPYAHHERWDGGGYPRGLRGEGIPPEARIFAVIDVYDALTSDRPYRAAWPRQKTIAHIGEEAGRHFDPGVVEAFLAMDL